MALLGTNWHGLRGPLFQKAKSEHELGKTEKWAGTLVEKRRDDDYEYEYEYEDEYEYEYEYE